MSTTAMETQLRTSLETKNARRTELLAKDNLSAEEMQELSSVNEECKGLLGDLKTVLGAADEAAELKRLMEGRSENPEDPDPAFKFAGARQTGQTVLNTELDEKGQKTTTLLDQTGEGLLSNSKMQKLNEKSYIEAFRSYARKGVHRMTGAELKNLEEGLDEQGGYFVPPEFINRIIQRTVSPTRVQSRVTMLQTGKDKISMPRLKYNDGTGLDINTTGFRVTWTGENPSSGTVHRVNDSDLFGRTQIDVYTAMMSSVITKDMAEDSDFPILSYISDKLAESVQVLRDEMIIQGSGIDQPSGILLNPDGEFQPESILSGVANSFNADSIRGFPFNLPEQYINENTCWVMNRHSTGKAVALLKDGEQRYLWARGSQDDKLANAMLDTLDGYPVIYSAFMPDAGDGAYPIIFGDLSGYYMVNRVGMSIVFYHDSAYDQLNQIGVGARLRFGGKVVEEFKIKIMESDDA